MLRFTPIENATGRALLLQVGRRPTIFQAGDLHREWGGKGAVHAGSFRHSDYEQFSG